MSIGNTRTAYGRFVIVRDRDGVRHAVARGAISLLREAEDGGTLLLLTGGRIVAMTDSLETIIVQIE